MEKKYYVYIIQTIDDKLYCGYTDNLEKRFTAHLNGVGAKYTKSHKPLKIVYNECYSTKSEAMKEEYRIKHLTRVQKLELIANKNTKL